MTWIKFAELETILGETERARAIYDLATQQPRLDMPEVNCHEVFTIYSQLVVSCLIFYVMLWR